MSCGAESAPRLFHLNYAAEKPCGINGSLLTSSTLRHNGLWRWLAAGNMKREAARLLFNSIHVTVSTICRISFACTQGRIETE